MSAHGWCLRERRRANTFAARTGGVRLAIALALGVSIVLASTVLATDSHDPNVSAHGFCRSQTADFPRTATVHLSSDRLPPITDLARYDVVVLDHEWQEREPQYLADLRATDPGVCLLAHVNLVDRPIELGSQPYWAGRYRLWQFTDDVTSVFPSQWEARTSAGIPVSEWPDTTMTNLTEGAPTVNGQSFAQHASDWVVDQVLSTGLWDGVFLDVWGDTIYTATADAWDITGDGVDVPDDQIYGAGGPWERGVTDVERRIRARAPNTILVGNGTRTLHAGLLDGLVWESFADPQSGREPLADLADYQAKASSPMHREPGLSITLDKSAAAESGGAAPRSARFKLAATLMQNGFWASVGRDYDHLGHYLDLGGGPTLPRGYLGQPVAENPTSADLTSPFHDGIGEFAPQVSRRDFANGIVLLNFGTVPQTVQFGRGFRDYDGQVVKQLTIDAQDGRILLST